MEFLGADFTPELAECVSSSAADGTEVAMLLGVIECDFDRFRTEMARGVGDAGIFYVEALDLTVEEADNYSRCVADEVLALSAETFTALTEEVSDIWEFGAAVVDSASVPCRNVLLDAVSLIDAPLVDKAVQTIIGDEEWEVFESDTVDDGTRTVFVENDVVSIGVTSLGASGRVLWIDLLFNSNDSPNPLVASSLIEVAALLQVIIDGATAQLLLDAGQDFDFDEVTICSTSVGIETYIEVVPNGYGCAHELLL